MGERLRVVNPQRGAGIEEQVDQDQGRSFAHVIRPRFERQTPDRNGLVLDFAVKVPVDLAEKHIFLKGTAYLAATSIRPYVQMLCKESGLS